VSVFNKIEMTGKTIEALKKWLECQDETVPVIAGDNSSLLVCYSLLSELGGPNDELAQFINGELLGRPADRQSLNAEIGTFGESYCLRIFSSSSPRILISVPPLQELVICRGEDIIISPAKIASKIRSQGLAPVIVRDWLKRALFTEFNPKTMSYRDQLWVLRNNEVMLYSELVSSGKIIFQDMHDITAHIAGLNSEGYKFAGEVAARVNKKLKSYFGPAQRGNLTSHLIPFLIGVILDGLTQSMIYGSESRRIAINELLDAIDTLSIEPQAKLRLNGFPKGIDVINGLFQQKVGFSIDKLKAEIKSLLSESIQLTSNLSSTALGRSQL